MEMAENAIKEVYMNVSRRDLLKTAGVGVLGAAALGTLAGCSSEGPGSGSGSASASEGGLETRHEVDILVVGAGVAGFCSAIAAMEAGVPAENIIIVDKQTGEGQDYAGSSMFMSGNYLYPTDPSEAGVEAFAQAMLDITGGVQNEVLIHTLAENAQAGFEWIQELGVQYNEEPNVGGGGGNDDASTRNMMEPGIAPGLRAAYEERGGQFEWNCQVSNLLMGDSGICGAVCASSDGMYQIKAKKVIICTGGMLSGAFWKEKVYGEFGSFIYSRAPDSITGDGLTLVESVGGVLAPLSHGKKTLYPGISYPGVVSNMTSGVNGLGEGSLFINADGERYIDESQASDSKNILKLLEQPQATIGVLTDSDQIEKIQESVENLEGRDVPTHTFDTLDEVAELFGCDADALKKTVEEYNAAIVGDRTEGLAVDKTEFAGPIASPPYYAWYPFILSSSFTGVGVQITTKAEATYGDGRPIPGLYAAGEVAGGIAYDKFFHGCNSTKAVVFGRIAGQECASDLL